MKMKVDERGKVWAGILATICWLGFFAIVGMSLTQNRLDPTDLEIIMVNANAKTLLAILGTLFLGLAWFTEEEA